MWTSWPSKRRTRRRRRSNLIWKDRFVNKVQRKRGDKVLDTVLKEKRVEIASSDRGQCKREISKGGPVVGTLRTDLEGSHHTSC